MSVFEINRGRSPVILAFPHTGIWVPDDIAARLNDEGVKLRDTDWRINLLYGGLLAGATTVRARFHRYVIDANRDPSGISLYPGQNTTGLVPTSDFDNRPIWIAGQEPTEDDIAKRVADYHAPYHAALEAEIARVTALHGIAVVYDCHSIRSRCPFLFDGVLPDFNIGTDNGKTCAPEIERVVAEICADAAGYTSVLNGRFRGGWTTRHYGRPEAGVHAIQMELAQSTHLETEDPPFDLDIGKSRRLTRVLSKVLGAIERSALELAGART
jgi:formiminoglutamase